MSKQKGRALLSITLSLFGFLAFVISSLRGDWWMQIFSSSAIAFSFAYMLYHYRKEARMNVKIND